MPRITVVGTARSLPGREADVAHAAAERLHRVGAPAAGRIDAYVFEDDDDHGLFVYVARWASRAAFEGHFRRVGQFGEPDGYAELPTVRLYVPFATYEEVATPSTALSLATIGAPPEAAPSAPRPRGTPRPRPTPAPPWGHRPGSPGDGARVGRARVRSGLCDPWDLDEGVEGGGHGADGGMGAAR